MRAFASKNLAIGSLPPPDGDAGVAVRVVVASVVVVAIVLVRLRGDGRVGAEVGRPPSEPPRGLPPLGLPW